MIDQKKIDEIVKKIADTIDPKQIILFGSYANGLADEKSDLDLLVIVESSNLPKYKRARTIRKHLWGTGGIPKDIVVYTEEEISEWKGVKFSFIDNILKEGKIVYENKKRSGLQLSHSHLSPFLS